MIKKTVIWVCGLVFMFAFAFTAFADQSIGYRQYFNEGVKAFRNHDDQKALRCFKLAQIYDPSDEELKRYLSILDQRGVVLELPPSQLPPEKSIGYQYYFKEGIRASQERNDQKAIRYFKFALIFNPASKESVKYLKILYKRHGLSFLPEDLLPQVPPQIKFPENVPNAPPQAQTVSEVNPVAPQSIAQPQVAPSVLTPHAIVPQIPEQTKFPENVPNAPPQAQTVSEVSPVPAAQINVQLQPYSLSAQPQPVTIVPQPFLYVPVQKAKGLTAVLSLARISNNGQIKPKLQIEYHSSVIIEGKNIQRFLVVDEGFIGVKIIDVDHLEVDAQGYGTTFLHIWDDTGRNTIYVEVIFPKSFNSSGMSPV